MAERTGNGSATAPSRSDEAKPCTICGRAVETAEWHPVVTDRVGDETRIRVFCSKQCREDWTVEEERSQRDGFDGQ